MNSREIAMNWWNNLSINQKKQSLENSNNVLMSKDNRDINTLTGREIETIYSDNKTDVKFYENNEEVYAIFIDEINPYDGNLFIGYAHIGQHSEYHIDYIKESKIATKEQYQDLYNELTKLIGYTNLNVLN